MTIQTTILAALLALFNAGLRGQADPTAIEQARVVLQRKYDEGLAELARLREEITSEKLPMTRQLREAEAGLLAARGEFQDRTRVLETRALSLTNLEDQIKWLEQDASHVENLLSEYMRNFESRLHIAEKHRYAAPLDVARLALENGSLPRVEVSAAQVGVVEAALARLEEAAGGTRFEGEAIDANGILTPGTFVLVGPSALFLSKGGRSVGVVEQRIESNEPSVTPLSKAEDATAATAVATDGFGSMPVDPSLGEASQIAALDETYWEHLQKGGAVMYPMFALAVAAFLVALYKWVRLMMVRLPRQRSIQGLLQSVGNDDREGARQEAAAIPGPVGGMLQSGVEHIGEPRELIEEVMYEHVLSTRLGLQRLLPFVAITAASAPLLGLLGTVTGIMNTFALMTVHGSGDAKALSSGISEALITTETGLYVAIPSLLLHAFLARKAKGVVDRMEKAAVAFLNRVGQVTGQAIGGDPAPGGGAEASGLTMDRVRDAVAELLAPALKSKLEDQVERNA